MCFGTKKCNCPGRHPGARTPHEAAVENPVPGPVDAMKIDCLMGTYGRHSLVCEALACFLQQSAISNATLLIYNQHPVPLGFDHPKVRVVNEAFPAAPLRHIKMRMLGLADPS